jgi:hypothetical protein
MDQKPGTGIFLTFRYAVTQHPLIINILHIVIFFSSGSGTSKVDTSLAVAVENVSPQPEKYHFNPIVF